MLGKQEISLSTRIEKISLELYAAAYNGVKTYLRYPMWIISDLVASPLWLLLFIIPMLLFLPPEKWGDTTTYQYFYWGMVFFDIISTSLWSFGNAIRREQEMGTLEYLFLSNANRIVLFATRFTTRLLSTSLSIVYLAALMWIMFGVQITVHDQLLLLFSLILSLFVASGFGALYGAAVLKLKQTGPLSNILQFVLIGVSGIFFPVNRLPPQLQILAYASPFTYCIDLARCAAINTPTLLPLWQEVLLVLSLAIIMNLLGLKALDFIENNTKKTGKLGAY